MAQRLGKPRKSGSPTPATARKIGILLDLVRHRSVSLKGCEQTYGASERTLLRDLQELRRIGEALGFRISEREQGDTFTLSEFKSKPSGLIAGERRLRALITELLKSFGEPMHELAESLPTVGVDTPTGQPFVHFVQPQLADGSAVRKVFDELYAAWQDNARVEIEYKGQKRTIEPAACVVRGGRYYLVGRDIAKGRAGWRTFSMDLMSQKMRRAGTFERKITPPPKYLSSDTIGFFKGEGDAQTVDVMLSKELAPSATSRNWQAAQTVRKNRDGTVTVSFTVDDVDEVLRWALSFGDEAWIVAPPAAVSRARELAGRITKRYR